MNLTFHVNLGPIKLRQIIQHIPAEIIGLDLNSEFDELVEKIKNKNFLKPFPNINDIPN